MEVAMSLRTLLKRKTPQDRGSGSEGGRLTLHIVNIVAVFDVETILKSCQDASPDPKKPTPIPQDAAYLLTEPRFLADSSTHATEALYLDAALDSILIWSGWSLSSNIGKSAVIYRIDSRSEESVSSPTTAHERKAAVPIPVEDPQTHEVDPLKFEPQTQTKYYLVSIFLNPGKQDFDIRFYITDRDRSSGEIRTLGYFSWSPSLRMKES
jgi:hypothetical protein